jgi:hypothetical protein
MHEQLDQPRNLLRTFWSGSALLTVTGLLMLVVLAGSLVGLMVDARTIGGAPAWLKPAKFAVSIAIYTFTLAWIFTYLAEWPRTRQFVSAVSAVTLIFEIAAIVTQAWRGTTSHFNVGTPFDMAVWISMGLAIVIQTVTSVAVAIALWRQRFDDAALGWALRLGMAMTIVGAGTGGLMTRPTAEQLAQAQVTHTMAISGAHTIGAPDGGPGLPVTGWSAEHGDGRVAHFAGLHALQAMLLIFLAVSRRRRSEGTRVRLIAVGAASYASLFAILLWQGLRGQALIDPDAATIAALVVWIASSVVAVWAVSERRGLPSAGMVY